METISKVIDYDTGQPRQGTHSREKQHTARCRSGVQRRKTLYELAAVSKINVVATAFNACFRNTIVLALIRASGVQNNVRIQPVEYVSEANG